MDRHTFWHHGAPPDITVTETQWLIDGTPVEPDNMLDIAASEILRLSCFQYGTSWGNGAGEFDWSEARNTDGSDRYVDGERVWPRLVRHHAWCPIALIDRIVPEEG